jgi:cardiolipin synthase
MVASYGLDAEHDVVRALEERARAGVRVTILTRPRPAVVEAAQRLVAAGAIVLGHDKLHAKAIVADGRGMVMTANLQTHGLDDGFEVGVHLNTEVSDALKWALSDWSQRFPWRFEPALERGEFVGEICLATEGLRTGMRKVEEEKVVTRQRLPRMERHPAGDRDIDDPAGVGGRFHRCFPRLDGRDAPSRGA